MTIANHNRANMAQEISITSPDILDIKFPRWFGDCCLLRIRLVAGPNAPGRVTWVALHGLGRDYLNARVLVPTVALLTITVFLAPGIATTSLFVALPLLTAGAGLLGADNHGLEYTFLVFLVTPIAAGVLALTTLRTYPRDVATAAESHRQQTNTRAGN